MQYQAFRHQSFLCLALALGLLFPLSAETWAQSDINLPVPAPQGVREMASRQTPKTTAPTFQHPVAFQVETPMNLSLQPDGDVFRAVLTQDVMDNNTLRFPKGAVVRGRLEKPSGVRWFSRSVPQLHLDQAMDASGQMVAVDWIIPADDMLLSPANPTSSTEATMGEKLGDSVATGQKQLKKYREKGLEAGHAKKDGVPMWIALPTSTIAGIVSATAATTVGAAKAVFSKSTVYVLKPGDVITVDYSRMTAPASP